MLGIRRVRKDERKHFLSKVVDKLNKLNEAVYYTKTGRFKDMV